MRLLATADLHYNQPKSGRLADELIDQINRLEFDLLLLVGDTAASDGDHLERCLSRFSFTGPKLFVAGNHELWTHGPDSYILYTHELPRRVRDAGWHWLQTDPFVLGGVGIVGSIGWYDYSFAPAHLGIPRRFYEHKVSPGAAEHFAEFQYLLEDSDDVPPTAREVYARWNDGRFVKLPFTDDAFLDVLIDQLRAQLQALAHLPHVLAAIHHLPFAELLPPPARPQWDFAKAYLGSARLGDTLLQFPNVCTLLCGHSHLPGEARIGPIHAINIGSGYRAKRYCLLDLPEKGSGSTCSA